MSVSCQASLRGEKSGDRPIKHQNREKPKKPRENQKNQKNQKPIPWRKGCLGYCLQTIVFFGYFGFFGYFVFFWLFWFSRGFFGFWFLTGIFSPNHCFFFFSFFCFFWFSPGFCGFWFLTEYAKCWLTRRLIGSDRNPVCLTPWDHYGPNTLKSEEYGNCTGAQAPFQILKAVGHCRLLFDWTSTNYIL